MSTNLSAKPRCVNFYDTIYDNVNNYNLNVVPYSDHPTYGFKLDYVYNFKKDEWELSVNKDGYFRVGQIVLEKLVEKIYVNDLIISINDEDIRSLDLNEKYLDDIYGDEIEIKLKRFNKELNNSDADKWSTEISVPLENWEPKNNSGTVKWSTEIAITTAMNNQIKTYYVGDGISLEQIILDLHSGVIFKTAGKIFMDIIALLLIFMAVSGVWIWFIKKNKA